MNDRDLVQRTLGGDRDAYRRLVERYRNAVYGLAISYVADFDLAEDLAQEAFIRGYYRLGTLTDGERFGGWLRTIAANLCRMEIRRRRAVPLLDDSLEALDTLSQKDREAVTLFYLEGQGVEEVGRFLGVSVCFCGVYFFSYSSVSG